MKKEKNNDKSRNSSTTSDRGNATTNESAGIEYGSNIRANGGNESSIDRESEQLRVNTESESFAIATDASANRSFKLESGYYFSPTGSVERIPNGYYLKPDGRLAKRRKRRNDNTQSTNGNINPNRAEASSEENFTSEAPIRVGAQRGRRTSKKDQKLTEAQQRLTMVTMLSVASTALFSSVSIFAGKHWSLEAEEANILAKSLNEALATLPAKSYEQIIGIVEKWVPWINLTFTLGAIIYPRVEYTVDEFKKRNPGYYQGSDTGQSRTENSDFSHSSPFTWNG